ncbi:MAG: AsmA family protein [Betaproteobacteria bacterium]|nr:AsmA family protein [Betaproteobacteria bacterium]
MRRPVKWVLMSVASGVTVLGLIVAYIAATFNPNDYKSDIIRMVQEKTGRTLQLKGDIGLTFYPTLGMKLGETSLSERRSDREFAHVATATVAVKLIPLMSKEVIVDAIEVTGLRATIVRDKSGRYNFEDLAAAEQKKPQASTATPLKIDIGHVAVADGDVTYVDQSAGAQYRFSNLNVKTGRLANGVTTPIDLGVLIASAKDKAQLDTKLKTKLTFDLERRLYKLEGLDFSTKGNLGTLSGINATAKGDVEARLATGEFITKGLAATLTAKEPEGNVTVKLDTPALTLTTDKVAGDKLALEVTRDNGKNKLLVKLTIAGVQGAFKSLKAGPLDATIETQGERAMKAHLTGSLMGNLEAKRFELPNLTLDAKITDPKLPKGSFDAALSGSVATDFTRETAAIDFSGRLDDSKVNGKAAATKFSPLALTFDVNADQFDADRMMSKSPTSDKIDLSALEGLNVAGTLKIGKLTLLNLKSSQVRADVKVANGRLSVAPLSARLYDGTLNGSLSAQAAQNPLFAVKQSLSAVALGPLLHDAAQIDTLEGKGTIEVDLSTRGATMDALKKALNGTAAVNVTDGAIKGVDIAGTIRGARTKLQMLRGEQVQQTNKTLKTDFSEMKATFHVKNGVAHNDDLTMKSPLLRVTGAGDLDIGADRMSYLLKATVVTNTTGQGGKDLAELNGLTVPVRLTGALDSPQYAIDFGGMATDFAKRQLQDELLKRALPANTATSAKGGNKIEDALKGGLKGIFGR